MLSEKGRGDTSLVCTQTLWWLEWEGSQNRDKFNQAKGNERAPLVTGNQEIVDQCRLLGLLWLLILLILLPQSLKDVRPLGSIFYNRQLHLICSCLPTSVLTEGLPHAYIPSTKILHLMAPREFSITTAMDWIVSMTLSHTLKSLNLQCDGCLEVGIWGWWGLHEIMRMGSWWWD